MNEIYSYIDRCLIDEYADKDTRNGYSLDVDDLPKREISNLLDRLMASDTNVRDYVLHEMQKLIEARLPEVEAQDRTNFNNYQWRVA